MEDSGDKLLRFNCQFLNDYLDMVEDTESPRLHHIWTALSIISGALGRRNWLPFGTSVIYPNQYIFLVGNPGTRKSTAANIGKRVLRESTSVRFAPGDTGGQRQGLVTAMLGQDSDSEKVFLNGVDLAVSGDSLMALTAAEIGEITDEIPEDYVPTHSADKHHLMAVIGEVSQFLGQNNYGMLDFLTQMWDGDDYDYQLKQSLVVLKEPLLNVLGCTTPTSLANSMPAAAGGQGFLSRVILVYGSKKYKLVPRPTAPNVDLVLRVRERIADIYANFVGPFQESAEAEKYSVTLYGYPLEITDSRFGYYHERRYTHVLKLAMCLAAGRGSQTIEIQDHEEAHRILRATERGMPDALGEFGLNPFAALKQQILEAVRSNAVLTLEHIQGQFHRDAKPDDIRNCVQELQMSNQVLIAKPARGPVTVHAVQRHGEIEDGIMNLLMEAE